MNSKLIHRLLASTVVMSFAVAAHAQAPVESAPAEPAVTSAADQDVGEIVVTGSRIPQPNLTSSSPITAVNAQEIKLQGSTRVEDVLNSLPVAFAAQSSSVSNGSNGTATANLRNLGDQRTLVLINGRRLQPGSPSSSATASAAPDLNVIPSILIKRVEVLTGGASSVYGSDAVAGVVNFVLDTDFEGISMDSSYGLYNHNNNNSRFQAINAASGYPYPNGNTVDGRQFDISMKIGTATGDGRGHLVAYAGYRKIGAIAQGSRDYSACGLGAGTTEYVCSGSANAAPANFFLGNGEVYGAGPNGTLNDGNLYNPNPLNYYQRPETRYTAGFMGRYEVSDGFKPYVEFNFMDDRTVAQIAPSGLFAGSGSVQTVNCDNPLLSAEQAAAFCAANNLVRDTDGNVVSYLNPDGSTYNRGNVVIARRNVEGGGRRADFRHTSYRVVIGSKGDIAKGLSYDAYGQFGSTSFTEIYRHEFSLVRATRATDVITDTRPGSATLGQPVCRSVVDGSDPSCVPYNLFSTDPIDPAALAYVEASGFQSGETKEKVVSGSLTFLGSEYGLQTPWASEGFGLNVGAEYREESVRLEVDEAFASGDLTGQGGPTSSIAGKYNVKEAFVEAQLPLVSDKPFFEELTLSAGYRYSDYSTSGSVSSYKGQLVWAPVRDIRFRGGYNRAVRAPNTSELFSPQSVQLDGSTDPCAGATPTRTQAQCVNTGVPADQYGTITANPAEQYNGLLGGNVNLKPETADTFTVGVILQPSFLPGFTATVDAFSVKIKNLISQIGADTIIDQCALTGDATLCSLVHRDPVHHSIWLSPDGYVSDTNVNAGSVKTRGIDVSANYSRRTDSAGTFSLSVAGTYLDEYRVKRAGVDRDCAGYFGSACQTLNTPASTPLPKWRHTARLTWDSPYGFGLTARWRYLSNVKNSSPSAFVLDRRIGSQSYFDLALTARIEDRMTFRLGANNILDREPPIVSQSAAPISAFGNGNTYPGLYDASGRYLFVGVSIDL